MLTDDGEVEATEVLSRWSAELEKVWDIDGNSLAV
jgi:hypothetical protein